MNRYFKDTRYYLGRAVEHEKLGVHESLHTIEKTMRQLPGLAAKTPEPTRRGRTRARVHSFGTEARKSVHDAYESVLQRVDRVRKGLDRETKN